MPSEFEVIQEAERFCLKRKIIKKMRYQHFPSEAVYNPNINIKTAPQPRFFFFNETQYYPYKICRGPHEMVGYSENTGTLNIVP